MTTVQSDDRGAVSIPPDMLRQIGVQPNAPVAVEVTGTVIIVRPPSMPWPEVEIYTPEMGLDPEKIPHDPPVGV
jgi:hypothetical protein